MANESMPVFSSQVCQSRLATNQWNSNANHPHPKIEEAR
jgi:hypothetical protein